MTSYLQLSQLFNYDVWANLKVLAVLEDHPSFQEREKTVSLFFHILGAQELWYRRIKGASLEELEVWPEYEIAECRSLIESQSKQWNEILDEYEDDLETPISYTNSQGYDFETKLSDILHHIVIHGQHHRAQIAMRLREAKIAPPPTDFIFYIRDKDS